MPPTKPLPWRVQIALLGAAFTLFPEGVGAAQLRFDAIGTLGGPAIHPNYGLSDTGGLPLVGRSAGAGVVEWAGFWLPHPQTTSGVPELPTEGGEAPDLPPALPITTRFVGVFPNPVGRDAEIRLDIAPDPGPLLAGADSPSSVRLELFDVGGRLAALVFDGELAPGNHHISWQPGNGTARSLDNGIYFFRFTCGVHQETRRIALLR